jgi:hypothetical protein
VTLKANQPGNTEHIGERYNIEHELVVAVLTTGPVGYGAITLTLTLMTVAVLTTGPVRYGAFPSLAASALATCPPVGYGALPSLAASAPSNLSTRRVRGSSLSSSQCP